MGIYKFCSCKYTNACMIWGGGLTTASALISSPKVGWECTLRILNHEFFVIFFGLFLAKGAHCRYFVVKQDIEEELCCFASLRKLGRQGPGFPFFYHRYFDVLKKKKEFDKQWIWYINTCIMISFYSLLTSSQPPYSWKTFDDQTVMSP